MSVNEAIVAQEEELKEQIQQAYKRIGELYYATRNADPEPMFEELVNEVRTLEEKLASLTSAAADGAVRKCHVCGSEIEDGYAFCSECGAPVKEIPAPAPMPEPIPAPVPEPMPAPAPMPFPKPMPAPAPAPMPMPAPAPAPAPVSEPDSFRKFTCSNCGAPIPPGADSCLNCGASAFSDVAAPSVPSYNNYNEDYEVGATTVLSAIQQNNNEDYEVGATTVLSAIQQNNNEDYEVGATTVLSAIQQNNNEDYEVGATTVLSAIQQNDNEDYEVGATTVLSANFAQPKATFYSRCSCGETIEPGTEFCPKCGARTTRFDVESIMHDVPNGYVRCTNCGEIVSKSEPYCNSCGFRMGKSRREL